MTQATVPEGTQRIFIGIPVGENTQAGINELLKPIKAQQQYVRWVTENNRHLTLAFLGNIPLSAVEHILCLSEETYRREKRFQFRLSALSRFPTPAGRILAVTGEPAKSLDHLYQTTLNLLHRSRIRFDRQEFRPHITLGRINKPQQVKEIFDLPVDIAMNITNVVIYQSRLTETGSIYSSLRTLQLN